ncbi:MAG: general secretion pathway protein GspB [Burkholderiaceae bacterium]|nr:general secretion pathway protein GspB [Burkholderiaceae bacterium]
MSYILDALRRAESERERGTVPTLSANPAAADLADDGVAVRRARPWVWAGLLLLLAVLGAVAAHWLTRGDAVPPAPALSVQTPTVVPAPPPPDVQAAVVAPAPVEAKPAPETKPRAPPRPPAPAAAFERPLPMASGLPEDLRRQLPPLVAGGAMYSESAAHRILIINGQLFREGDKIAPELVLEQIKHRGAVLSFKGQRFRISY